MHRMVCGVILLVFASLIAAAASGENVLRWSSVGGAITMDPHGFNEVPTRAQSRRVYGTLTEYDSNLDFVPQLATAWRPVGTTSWEFELREDVRFHDGTPLRPGDVVFSIDRARKEGPAGFAQYVRSIRSVQAVDDFTVRIETSAPDLDLPVKLAQVGIMSERWATTHEALVAANVNLGEENYASRHANGTGPFILESFEPDGPVVLVRNPDWWGYDHYPHNIDRVGFTPIADPARRLEALLDGKLDLLTDPPFDQLDRIEAAPGLKLVEAAEPRIVFLGFDQASAELRSSDVKGSNPFGDVRVRRAIYQAIDIEAIRVDVMQGRAIPAGMILPPGVNGHAPDLDQRLPHAPEAAKALLAGAGYPDGFSVVLDCPNNRYINDEAICHAASAQLGAIGINVTVNAQPKMMYFAKVDNDDTDFYLGSIGVGSLDSHEIVRVLYRTDAPFSATGYSRPEVDALIDKIGKAMIKYGRDALIEDVWKMVLADIVYVPLHSQVIVWAMRENLHLPVFPFNRPLLREARFR